MSEHHPEPALGCSLPVNSEAEEHLISCCLLDGVEVVRKCVDAGITPESFHDKRHAKVFEVIIDLHNRRQPTDVSVVAQELKAAHELERIGGYAFLAQVSSKIPTTAHAAYFIERVHDEAIKRNLLRKFADLSQYCRETNCGSEDVVAHVRRQFDAFTLPTPKPDRYEMPLDELLRFNPHSDTDTIMGRRFLCRTGGAVIVAPSGVGKSVLSMGLACCAAMGRPFFGVRMVGAMRVLYVQAEDDAGDVAESLQGYLREYPVSHDECGTLKANLRIVRWNDAAGEKFLARLRSEYSKHPWDLVIINPLFSFCGCNVSEQAEMSRFLRNGLNPILNETRSAAVIVHHTNKPPTDTKERPDSNSDLRYIGSGSAELTNWARAYITLQPVKGGGDGVARMVFAKRGTRAGIVDENGHTTTAFTIEHSKNGLCWVPSSRQVELSRGGGKFTPRFDLCRARALYDSAQSWDANEQAIALDQDVSRKTVSRRRQLIQNGHGHGGLK